MIHSTDPTRRLRFAKKASLDGWAMRWRTPLPAPGPRWSVVGPKALRKGGRLTGAVTRSWAGTSLRQRRSAAETPQCWEQLTAAASCRVKGRASGTRLQGPRADPLWMIARWNKPGAGEGCDHTSIRSSP